MIVSCRARGLSRGSRQHHFRSRPQVPNDPAAENESEGDELGSAEHSSKYRASARIVAQKFQEESCNAVQEKICPENLPVEFFVLEHPGEKKEDAQLNRRLEQLGGLKRVA